MNQVQKFLHKVIGVKDNLYDMMASMTNTRNARNRNRFVSTKIDDDELREIYKTGTASKIYRLKTNLSLNGTIEFDSTEDEKIYDEKIASAVKKAVKFMFGFGRGIVVIHEKGAVLDQPLKDNWNRSNYKLDVFSGDMTTVGEYETDLSKPRYYKPIYYTVKGERIHWTRVADFTYYEPVEDQKADYKFGGISEAELIYTQLINDGVIERASASIIEKNSNLFYKVKGFRDLVRQNKHDQVLTYFRLLENQRSLHGATILDDEDTVEQLAQTLTNLKETDEVSKMRLGMVTGIPMNILMGDNNRGLNANGDNDQKTLNDTISGIQSEFLIETLNDLVQKLGLGAIKFKREQARTPLEQANYEKTILNNALVMAQMGEDHAKYLEKKGITEKDEFASMFEEV